MQQKITLSAKFDIKNLLFSVGLSLRPPDWERLAYMKHIVLLGNTGKPITVSHII
jgi:hypothetical protein